MPHQIVHALYSFIGGWQYYKTVNGKRQKDGTPHFYKNEVEVITLEKDMDKKWDDVLKSYPSSKSKEYVIKDKSYKILNKVGFTVY